MRRLSLGTALALVAMLTLGATAVFAANPHVVGALTTTSSGNQTTVSGKIAGLGSGYAGTTLTATADASFDVTCSNPQGKVAPGQQGATATLTGQGALDSVSANGTYTFHVTFTTPTLSPAKAYGCPNNKWTATATNLSLTLSSITLADGTHIAP